MLLMYKIAFKLQFVRRAIIKLPLLLKKSKTSCESNAEMKADGQAVSIFMLSDMVELISAC